MTPPLETRLGAARGGDGPAGDDQQANGSVDAAAAAAKPQEVGASGGGGVAGAKAAKLPEAAEEGRRKAVEAYGGNAEAASPVAAAEQPTEAVEAEGGAAAEAVPVAASLVETIAGRESKAERSFMHRYNIGAVRTRLPLSRPTGQARGILLLIAMYFKLFFSAPLSCSTETANWGSPTGQAHLPECPCFAPLDRNSWRRRWTRPRAASRD